MMEKMYSSMAYRKEICNRAKRYRIDYPLTQQELADKAGLSLRSIQNFESGKDIKLDSFIKILIVLGLDMNLDMLIPDDRDRPSRHLPQYKERKRASRKREQPSIFKWGDEQ